MVDLDQFGDVQKTGVLLATVAAMGLGFLWYHPKSPTGRRWMQVTGITQDMARQGNPAFAYGVYALGLLLSSWAIAWATGFSPDIWDALLVTLFMALTVAVPTMLGPHLFEKRPWPLLYIGGGYVVTAFLLMAVVIRLLGETDLP